MGIGYPFCRFVELYLRFFLLKATVTAVHYRPKSLPSCFALFMHSKSWTYDYLKVRSIFEVKMVDSLANALQIWLMFGNAQTLLRIWFHIAPLTPCNTAVPHFMPSLDRCTAANCYLCLRESSFLAFSSWRWWYLSLSLTNSWSLVFCNMAKHS